MLIPTLDYDCSCRLRNPRSPLSSITRPAATTHTRFSVAPAVITKKITVTKPIPVLYPNTDSTGLPVITLDF